MNLLRETLDDLKFHGKGPGDVLWVGSRNCCTTWDNFESVADTEYDSGYGSPEVAQNLLIVGDGWWIERHEHNGAEGWVYKEQVKRPESNIIIESLTAGQARSKGVCTSFGWESLENLNGIGKDNERN